MGTIGIWCPLFATMEEPRERIIEVEQTQSLLDTKVSSQDLPSICPILGLQTTHSKPTWAVAKAESAENSAVSCKKRVGECVMSTPESCGTYRMTSVSIRSEKAAYGSLDHTGGIGRLSTGYMVSNADVTVRCCELEEAAAAASLSLTVRGMSSMAAEDLDLRLFLDSEPDFDSRRLLLLSLLDFALPSFDIGKLETGVGVYRLKDVEGLAVDVSEARIVFAAVRERGKTEGCVRRKAVGSGTVPTWPRSRGSAGRDDTMLCG